MKAIKWIIALMLLSAVLPLSAQQTGGKEYSPAFTEVTSFNSWNDLSKVLGLRADFYGKARGVTAKLTLRVVDGTYWLFIDDVKFLPVHPVKLTAKKAILGLMDRGKPIKFSMNLGDYGDSPYIMFDTQQTESIIQPGVYGWEYYQPELCDGKPQISMYTGDSYTGRSSKPQAAKYIMVQVK